MLVTCDQNIRYQQNLAGRALTVIVLTTNHWNTIRENAAGIQAAVASAAEGVLITVQLPKAPRRRRPYLSAD